MTKTTNTAVKVRTGEDHVAPNYRAKNGSASFGSVASSCLINGTVTIDAYDHNSGRKLHLDFCLPWEPATSAIAQANRMRELADTLLREAERLELLIEKQAQAERRAS
jgi:hypothetical protein